MQNDQLIIVKFLFQVSELNDAVFSACNDDVWIVLQACFMGYEIAMKFLNWLAPGLWFESSYRYLHAAVCVCVCGSELSIAGYTEVS